MLIKGYDTKCEACGELLFCGEEFSQNGERMHKSCGEECNCGDTPSETYHCECGNICYCNECIQYCPVCCVITCNSCGCDLVYCEDCDCTEHMDDMVDISYRDNIDLYLCDRCFQEREPQQ